MDAFKFVRLRALFVDLLQEGRKLSEAKIFSVALFPAEQAEHFGVLHDENWVLISNGRIEQNVGEPLHRASRACGTAFEAQFLFAMNDQERIAPNRV